MNRPALPAWRLKAAIAVAMCCLEASAAAQSSGLIADPGPRGGAPGAGGTLAGLGPRDVQFFNGALAQFTTVDSVSGAIAGESGSGLGPRFNGNVCSACHAFPAPGGASPAVNPQVAMATLDGAHNRVPPFITADGPVREARFKLHANGAPDGRVHELFTIAGRSDAPGCTIEQPDFTAQMAAGNVALRIPTELFGLGLVENVPDSTLLAARAAHAEARAALGISGHYNHDANDGSISRFGWKAQDKSLLTFAGEAYNVEQGVTNELFPSELASKAGCAFTAQPEDGTFFRNTIHSGSAASDLSSATVNFAGFMRLLAPPKSAPMTAAEKHGRDMFAQTGCEACHFETLATTGSIYPGQSNVTFHPYSDFAVHKMGDGLADGISQGQAKGDEFRTAPLWGIGQRLFFLHDGRTTDLVQAIAAHASSGSEANGAVARFQALPAADEQAILAFLRAL